MVHRVILTGGLISMLLGLTVCSDGFFLLRGMAVTRSRLSCPHTPKFAVHHFQIESFRVELAAQRHPPIFCYFVATEKIDGSIPPIPVSIDRGMLVKLNTEQTNGGGAIVQLPPALSLCPPEAGWDWHSGR
jgi:hypothetical protein